jgi:subtilase family serine protease
MYRMLSAGMVSAGVMLGAVSIAAAEPVEHSGSVYHVAVCSRLIQPKSARCHAHVVTDAAGKILFKDASVNVTPSGYGPSSLRSAYNITATGSSTTTIAIVDAYGYTNAEADLGVYRAQYGLPACTTANGCFAKYNQNGVQGSYPAQNTGWAQETALDLDMASAMCPNCKIILVEATSATDANLGTAVNTAAAKGAHVISNSYGGGESGTQSYEAGPQFPATSPHTIAVGGTHLVTANNARGWTETVWTDGGSGCSTVYAKPTWQTDTGCSKRMEADVAADADPNTGVAVYGPVSSRKSGWEVFGGTRVAAPLVGANGGAVSYASTLYANPGALYDVTSGNNGSCSGKPAYFCNAEVGYDGPTGLGTPNGITAF